MSREDEPFQNWDTKGCDGLLIQIENIRNRMWSFMFLCSLGLNICQASGEGISTQMYYSVVEIEESAIKNITEMLKSLILFKENVRVDKVTLTTNCDAQNQNCICMSDHKWSDEVCESQPTCCRSNTCSISQSSAAVCVSKSTVTISGTLSLTEQYHECLAGETTPKYRRCHDDLLTKLKTVFSTVRGFDRVQITKFSLGSVIVHFEWAVVFGVSPIELFEKAKTLSQNLQSEQLFMETKGVVLMHMTSGPVCNKTDQITCTSEEDLNAKPEWHLTTDAGLVFDITDGTESVVTSSTGQTTVMLNYISENWAGEFSCAYHQKFDFGTITHKARDTLDVVLLPDIYITSDPMFPRCEGGSTKVKVTVKCEIKASSEVYEVKWHGHGKNTDVKPLQHSNLPSQSASYTADTIVDCNPDDEPEKVTCTFTNRCDLNRAATLQINVIGENEVFCEREGDWGDTKVNFTAVLKCMNSAGKRFRGCKQGGEWDEEESMCVNMDLNKIREWTEIIDIGLGKLDTNAANVLSRLEAATNNSGNINTYSNVNISVSILSLVTNKTYNIDIKQSTLDDFLQSSSNLLNESLEESWTKKIDKDGSLSLAEQYLSTVANLIEHTKTMNTSKRTSNIEVEVCNSTQGSHCTNSVFGADVSLGNFDPGTVKTTGFKQLNRYLPHEDPDFEPNSIVVSTTIEKKQSDSTVIKIDFPLLKKRPRNYKMKCVSWNKTSRRWSSGGCSWQGPYTEGHCKCQHLSSFAILMSKAPLDIPLIDEITHTGLAVSIVSLILCIAIELTTWSSVVKTSTSYLRHAAHINISLSLLIADCCFLAASFPQKFSQIWCQIMAVFMHFCYLSVFFWMLCLSATLLHQTVFIFHSVSKRDYLKFSLLLGYTCPFLIVFITFITNNSGAEGSYYCKKTCWLIYVGFLQGSIHTFLIPVGIIVVVNVFCIFVVIMKLLDRTKSANSSNENEKQAAKNVIKSVILLTPIFGVTWIFGFAVMALDLSYGPMVFVVNYIFTVLNAFQGLFILVTICLGDKSTRDALLKHFCKKPPAPTSESSTKLDSKSKN